VSIGAHGKAYEHRTTRVRRATFPKIATRAPVSDARLPFKEVRLPFKEVRLPFKEVRLPFKEVRLPFKEVHLALREAHLALREARPAWRDARERAWGTLNNSYEGVVPKKGVNPDSVEEDQERRGGRLQRRWPSSSSPGPRRGRRAFTHHQEKEEGSYARPHPAEVARRAAS
jgi:hypothetical protein